MASSRTVRLRLPWLSEEVSPISSVLKAPSRKRLVVARMLLSMVM